MIWGVFPLFLETPILYNNIAMNAMGKLKRPRHLLDPDADIDEDKDKRGERAWIPPTGCCSRGGGLEPWGTLRIPLGKIGKNRTGNIRDCYGNHHPP